MPVEPSPSFARYTRGMFSRFRLAEVAALLADPGRAGMVTALWDGTARPAGELARIAGVTPATASSHLARLVAGGLGVAVSDALLARRLLTLRGGDYGLPPAGRRWFERMGIEVAPLEQNRRPLLRSCIDWSERREHLGGSLGAALATQLLERDWLRRRRDDRALLVTSAGRIGLSRTLGLRLDD